MGYFSNERIAKVHEPAKITLANTPNFVEFLSKGTASGDKNGRLALEVLRTDFTVPDAGDEDILVKKLSKIEIKGADSTFSLKLTGTFRNGRVNDTTFLIVRKGDKMTGSNIALTQNEALNITAQNIRACLMKNNFLKNNFEIDIPVALTNGRLPLIGNNVIEIKSKGVGQQYNLFVFFNALFINEKGKIDENKDEVLLGELISTTGDTIDAGGGGCQIELDIYTNTGLFPGESDNPVYSNLGQYVGSLSKSYFGERLWFDPNQMMARKVSYSTDFLSKQGWVDAGTAIDYRFTAKRMERLNNEVFYYSNVLYVINGYNYPMMEDNIEEYIFDINKRNAIKPLTTRPVTMHVKGQKQFFNFILKDAIHSLNNNPRKSVIGLLYKFRTQSGAFIMQEYGHLQTQEKFNIVNTVEMNLDDHIKAVSEKKGMTVGQVEVLLCCNGIEVSAPVVFKILPERLHSVNDFVFLNRLGGWDSFNFGAGITTEFKASVETTSRSVLPQNPQGNHLDKVAYKTVSEQLSVKTEAIPLDVAEWLKELSSSTTVYELSTGRYIIANDFTIKYDSKSDLFQGEMKFSYSDAFNFR